MNKVMGKVLVKETGAGVPDLVVVVYDVDTPSTSAPVASAGPAAPNPRTCDHQPDRCSSERFINQ